MAEMPRAAKPEIKSWEERGVGEKISGLETLIESLIQRQKALVNQFGTDRPENPSEAQQLRSIEELIMWKERDVSILRDIQANEERYVADRAKLIELVTRSYELSLDLSKRKYPIGMEANEQIANDSLEVELREVEEQIAQLKGVSAS